MEKTMTKYAENEARKGRNQARLIANRIIGRLYGGQSADHVWSDYWNTSRCEIQMVNPSKHYVTAETEGVQRHLQVCGILAIRADDYVFAGRVAEMSLVGEGKGSMPSGHEIMERIAMWQASLEKEA
jgi:hypothetical protein